MLIRIFVTLFFAGIISSGFTQHQNRKAFDMYEDAESFYNDGKFQSALTTLNECLKLYPGYKEAYALRGNVREQLKDRDGALTDYSIYLETFPENPDILMSRATLRYNLGFYDQAKQDFLTLLTLSAPETNAIFFRQNMSVNDRNIGMTTTETRHHAVVLNYLGLLEMKTKNAEGALKFYDSAIRLDPKEPDYFINRGLAKEVMNDSTAMLDYEMALRLNPNDALAKHNLEAYKAKNNIELSEEERLTRTIEVDSTMLYPYLERAQQRYESGYYKGALDDYNQALKLDEDNVEIYFARGQVKEKLKDYEGAFSDYTKAIEMKENYAKVWLSRGNTLLKLERYADAIEDYTVAIIYYPDYPHAFYNRGMAQFKLNKNEDACKDFNEAERLGMKVDEKLKAKVCKPQK